MTLPFRILAVSIAMLAAPAIAQTDPHADHQPAAKPAAPPAAPSDAARARCPMMGTSPAGAESHDGKPKPGAGTQGMMGANMSPAMMKKCMGDTATPATEHPHAN